MDITLIKINGQGWEFPYEDNWPCAVAFALGDPPNPVTEEEADRQAKLIAAAPALLDELQRCVKVLQGVVNDTLGDKTGRDAVCATFAISAMAAIDKATK